MVDVKRIAREEEKRLALMGLSLREAIEEYESEGPFLFVNALAGAINRRILKNRCEN